ncbi:MAG: hypothetical protein IPM96_14090 [Ignavibacteria bacterium]|nr:hypothetical protein [Ignavibacteria bacterium]
MSKRSLFILSFYLFYFFGTNWYDLELNAKSQSKIEDLNQSKKKKHKRKVPRRRAPRKRKLLQERRNLQRKIKQKEIF